MNRFLLFFIAPFLSTGMHAQYLSGNGRGDTELLKNIQGLNGEDINVLYHGTNGRGDVQLLRTARALSGEDIAVVYYGGNGRGDAQLLKPAWPLSGEDVVVVYYGGNGRGDAQLLKNAQGLNGDDINVMYYGSNGRGDAQFLKSGQALSGEDVAVVYYGGTGRGDVFSGVISGLADCAVTFYWNGSVSDVWENPANWNCNALPGINSDVVIPSGLLNYPKVNISTEIKRLELKAGTSITVNPGVILKLNGQ